jgi:hypothetical protein
MGRAVFHWGIDDGILKDPQLLLPIFSKIEVSK